MSDFVSVNGLGGGMELGFVQSLHTLKHRAGTLNLGAPVVEGNRPLMGWEWESSFSEDPREWPRFSAPLLIGNPPCSAWSTLTRKDLRGGDAKVMHHTQVLFDYAALMPRPPKLIIIESVQQAYTTGQQWYRDARDELEQKTGKTYDLHWVMQSNASLGGCSVRKRVFVVLARIPFGVEYVQPNRVARLGDAIRDLEGLSTTMAKQPYMRPATWWSVPMRSEDGVDGMTAMPKFMATYEELIGVLAEAGVPWPVGADTTYVLRELYARTGQVPMPWGRHSEKLIARNFDLGLNQTGKWDPEKQGRVVTGQGPGHSVHYSEPRTLTYRECARIQGFPDTWRIWPARDYNHLAAIWGKGVPVDAGRWIGYWAGRALDGEPGTISGTWLPQHREHVIDVTNAFKRTLELERPWDHQRYVAHEHGHWVDREHDSGGLVCCD